MFGEVIKYLKGHLMETLEKRGTQIDNKDIHWVLTVPAIWTDSAKQFMREAAYKVRFNIFVFTEKVQYNSPFLTPLY